MNQNLWSVGSKIVVEAYKKEALRTQEKNGFAFVDQKMRLKGLKILVEANLTINNVKQMIPKNAIAYVKEELLHTQQWAAKPLESDAIEQPFLVIDVQYVEFFGYPLP